MPVRILLLFLFMVAPAAARRGDSGSKEAHALLERARDALNIRAEGAPSFRIRARVDVAAMPSDAPPGSWTFTWFDESHWREELILPGYRSAKASNGGEGWRLVEPDIYLPVVKYIERLVKPSSALRCDDKVALRMRPAEKGSSIEQISPNGSRAARFRTVQIERESARLVALEPPVEELRFEYEGQTHLGERVLPAVMRVSSDRKEIATVTIESVEPAGKRSPAIFEPPSGAQLEFQVSEGTECETLVKPRQVHRVTPVYPGSLKRKNVGGRVTLRAVVGIDGSVGNLQVLGHPLPQLVEPALKAVEQWAYEPATCDGRAVPFVMTIRVSFTTR